MAKIFRIGVYGSSAGDFSKIRPLLEKLGAVLASKEIVLITGACNGVPYFVGLAAFKNGARKIWEYSSCLDFDGQQKEAPEADLAIYEKLVYIPKEFEFYQDDKVTKKYRNVISAASCDGAIIISGRWGTLNEFTNLFDMGKVIGVLTDTGGIADELPRLMEKINKPSKAKVIFNNDPAKLVDLVLKELESRR